MSRSKLKREGWTFALRSCIVLDRVDLASVTTFLSTTTTQAFHRSGSMPHITERAKAIFATVLEEFNTWDEKDSRLSLKSLKPARTAEPPTRYVLPWQRPDAVEQDPKELVINVPEPSFAPTALYESSPLADRNIYKGDDASSLAAIPFIDDKTFDWRSYAKDYDTFDWDDMDRHNPNCELS